MQKFTLLVSAVHEDLCITQLCLESNLVVILSKLFSNGVVDTLAAPQTPFTWLVQAPAGVRGGSWWLTAAVLIQSRGSREPCSADSGCLTRALSRLSLHLGTATTHCIAGSGEHPDAAAFNVHIYIIQLIYGSSGFLP